MSLVRMNPKIHVRKTNTKSRRGSARARDCLCPCFRASSTSHRGVVSEKTPVPHSKQHSSRLDSGCILYFMSNDNDNAPWLFALCHPCLVSRVSCLTLSALLLQFNSLNAGCKEDRIQILLSYIFQRGRERERDFSCVVWSTG